MAFDINNFGRVSCHNNDTLRVTWGYTTEDAAGTIDTAGYFDEVSDLVKVGDVIEAQVDTDGTPGYKEFFVSEVTSAGVVDVNDATAAPGEGSTDSD